MNSDDPDVVCFTVREDHRIVSTTKVWVVEVSIRSKEVLSAFPCTIDPWRAESHVAVKLNWS